MTTLKKIAVIGASGFVGQAISREIQSRPDLQLISIVRGDDSKKKITSTDVVIHAANPAKRFWAEQNPQMDFSESIEKTYKILKEITFQKLILISSISARTQLYSVYGRHRRCCEMLVEGPNHLVVRLGPMYGGTKKIGALYDILANKPVYVSGQTRYSFVPVEYNARKIIDYINRSGTIELGSKNAIVLSDLRDRLGSSSEFSGQDDTQIPIGPAEDAPDAYDVIAHANFLKMSSLEHL